jgi:branched-chain amino acid transport system ATP-binding protein
MTSTDGVPPILEVQELDAYYGKSQVIFALDLLVGPGEAVAVLGRNGAGKTTALMAIAGVINSRARALRLGGHDISHMPSFKRVRSGLSLVPSGSRAFPNLTVNENLELVRGRTDGGARWTTDDAYRTFPKLAELKDNSAGGERQMLAVARAMLAGPQLLMLDEPSEGLAPMVVKGIAERLQHMRGEGIGVLLTEQNHRLALDVADRVYFLEKGQVVWEGSAEQAGAPEVIERYLAV